MSGNPTNGDELAELLLRWRSAEAKLYPMVLVNPEGYEIGLRLVRWISDRLVELPATDDLIEAYKRRSELLAQASSELSVPDPGALAEPIIDAAFLSGHRQLVEKLQQETAQSRIVEADAEGWIVLSEVGTSGIPGYRRLEMRLPDGLGLYSQVSMNPDTYQPVYSLEFLRLDPTNGNRIDGEGPFDYASFDDPAVWSEALEAAHTPNPP